MGLTAKLAKYRLVAQILFTSLLFVPTPSFLASSTFLLVIRIIAYQETVNCECMMPLNLLEHPDDEYECPLSRKKICSIVDESHLHRNQTKNELPNSGFDSCMDCCFRVTNETFSNESNKALVKNGDTCDKPTPLLSSTWRLSAVDWTLCTWVLATVAGCLLKNKNSGAYGLKDVKPSQNCVTIGCIQNSLILGLNILAALLLMGSDYIRQCLLTPTRMDIDVVHSKNKWFIIGNQNFSNFRIAPVVAIMLWLSLLLTSLPIQLPNASSIAWATLAPLQKALEDLQVQRVNRSMVLESYALAGHDTTQQVSMFLSPPTEPRFNVGDAMASCLEHPENSINFVLCNQAWAQSWPIRIYFLGDVRKPTLSKGY
ncbi:hypothetical protein BELL_0086g00150 [Botrytis elliptica]|uniref:DUF6536 domain-containing protein n=1 Tax=Botrytis elliptica TaxID=278938 RepID=A0A4Z1JVJ3_9HELO|nr:hypothetical protein EAE99_004352 [Botrytis elliptica]TGO77909.1 hypothetical protein BELL_0086g00150 [Botrytis elliptica]